MKRTTDYMFMASNDYYKANGCAIEACLDPEFVEQDGHLKQALGNPCHAHPSDHYSLAYLVQINRPALPAITIAPVSVPQDQLNTELTPSNYVENSFHQQYQTP